MAEREEISYDMIDPLKKENPFYIDENSKINMDSKAGKFPTKPILIYMLIIPLAVFLTAIFYIGGTWDPIGKIPELEYVIVNEDSGCTSQLCKLMGLNESTNIGASYGQLNGKAGKFDYVAKKDYDYAVEKIEDHDYWMALHIPKTFTVDLLSNLKVVSNTTFTPVKVSLIYDEARSYTTVTYSKKAFAKIEKVFYSNLLKTFSENFGQFNAPFLINGGIEYEEKNLHVVNGFGQNFSTFISLLLIWIGTMATSIISHFFYPFEKHWIEKKNANNAIAKTIILKTVICAVFMFLVSVLVSVIPFFCGDVVLSKGYGAFLFFLFFYSLVGLGVNNLLIHLLPFIQYYLVIVAILILQLISCGGLVDTKIQYGFFKIGKALPMYYGVRELKYIYWLSGSQYQTANVLVLLAWAIVTICGALFMYYLELKVKRRRWLKENEVVEAKN